MIHPIGFSIPEEKVVSNIPIKEKILAHIIPGQADTYIYNNETDYYNDYRISLFAITCKKAGWDCMRHYEILANGCIPLFKDIETCPDSIMTFLPKELLRQGQILYDQLQDRDIHEINPLIMNVCEELIEKMLNHTRNYLTTRKMAQYILDSTGNVSVKKILYLSGNISPDYLRCVTLHGLKSIFGVECHDYPKIPHLYKSTKINYSSLYGKGITYTNLLDQSLHDHDNDDTIIQDIQNKYYDIVIYGSYHRGMPFYDKVTQLYSPGQIILLCGEETHCCDYDRCVGHHVFVRELN